MNSENVGIMERSIKGPNQDNQIQHEQDGQEKMKNVYRPF